LKKEYSQVRAMLAITKASLLAIRRSPSAIVFSIAFPLIFILVFGFLGSGGHISLRVAIAEGSDTTNAIYGVLKNIPGINIIQEDAATVQRELERGRITAVLNIRKNDSSASPSYIIDVKSSEAVNPQNLAVLSSLLNSSIQRVDEKMFTTRPTYARVNDEVKKIPGRTYRTIDFILPGQLGFSLLSAGIFGVAFIFFNLRQTLVLKRFFATPIKKSYIIFGEGLSRVIFQMTTAVIILLVGHFAFKFTLVHGWLTFLELLALSFIGLIVFMGFGFVVSGLAKSESTIPPFANLITMPQFLLAGTFFPIDNFPTLTHLNDAMRNVAFEGDHLTECGPQLLVLAIWGILVYAIAVKVFRWE
jgi:ABC-2 type transport system permease protein